MGVFFDPYRMEMSGGREDYGEDRWVTIDYADPVFSGSAVDASSNERLTIWVGTPILCIKATIIGLNWPWSLMLRTTGYRTRVTRHNDTLRRHGTI